jgi:hypothetical protein
MERTISSPMPKGAGGIMAGDDYPYASGTGVP